MQAARRSAAWISEELTKPGAGDRMGEVEFRDPLLHAVALRSVAEDETADLSIGPSDYVNRRHYCRCPLLRDVPPREHNEWFGVLGFRCLRRPRVQAFKDCDGASQPALTEPAGVKPRKQKAWCGTPAELLHAGSDSTAEPAEVSDPVGATPDLEPVHHQSEALPRSDGRGSQKGKVRKGGGMNDVVVTTMA